MNMKTSHPAQQMDIKSLQEENDLLLCQLTQVQEEMEHYFLLNQTNERQVAELTLRLETANRPKQGKNPLYKLTDLLGITIQEKIETIASSGFFDRTWYLEQYPDIAKNGMDPVRHYLLYGANEGRNPGPHFDTSWYLDTYPDVAKDGMNPLLHYERYGKAQGNEPRVGGVQIPDRFAEERKWLQLAKDEATKLAENRQKQIEQLTRERDEQAYWHQENANWANALVAEKEELVTRLNGLQEVLDRQQQVQFVQQQEVAALAGARDDQILLAEERQAALDRLIQNKTELEAAHLALKNSVVELAQERDEQKFIADSRRGEIQYLNEALMAETARGEVLRQEVAALARARDEQMRLAQERLVQIKSELEVEQQKLQQSAAELVQERDEQKFLADSRRAEIQQLNETLVIEAARCGGLQQQLEQFMQQQSAWTGQRHALEKEVAALKQSVFDRTQERDEQAHWHQENANWAKLLVVEKDALESRLAGMHEELNGLKQMHVTLEQEKSTLLGRHNELVVEKDALESRLAGVHEELIGLKQMHVALEQEKSTLLGRHHELEQDLKALTCARDEQVKLAQERSKQINDLQQQIQSRQAGEVDLAARQQLMHEEMVRAEAQIDLIKDMLLREQGI
jgi:hypothetical protein